MAAADYALCARCSRKVFYDAEVDYDVESFGESLALCSSCKAEGARLQVLEPLAG